MGHTAMTSLRIKVVEEEEWCLHQVGNERDPNTVV